MISALSGRQVNEEGFRQGLTVRVLQARTVLRTLSFSGAPLTEPSWSLVGMSDDRECIKAALRGELPRVGWRRCILHFQHSFLAYVWALG